MTRKGKEWLTVPQVRNAKTPGRLADGAGLYLAVSAREAADGSRLVRRSWVYLYTAPNGARREMGLGSADALDLKDARAAADAARKLLGARIDPLEDRKAKEAAAAMEAARSITFKVAALQYIESQRAGWKHPKHAKLWESSLTEYAFPVLGALAVAAINEQDVLRCIEPIWKTKTETASRVRGRIESILDWCSVRGFRDRNTRNPASWRGNLEKALPRRSKVRRVKHHAALPYQRAAAFMAELREQGGVGALALEFTALTAARTGEVLGARWSEIDFPGRVWLVPAERTKTDKALRIPLSRQALAVLERAQALGNRKWIFPGSGASGHLSNMAMLQTLARMGRKGAITSHGFRSTFRSWVFDTTSYSREIAEQALGHAAGDRVEAAYKRSDAYLKRARLMQLWADYCDRAAAEGATVVTMKRTQSDAN
jgi:integrase